MKDVEGSHDQLDPNDVEQADRLMMHPCKRCGAGMGMPCRSASGVALSISGWPNWHSARRKAAGEQSVTEFQGRARSDKFSR